MQAPLSKKMLMSVLRAQLRALDPSILSSSQPLPTVRLVSATPRTLIQVPSFSFSDKDSQFEKVTSYESLISRISNSGNINDLLNTMNQNLMLYKNEHIVLTLRVMARLIRNTPQTEIDSLPKDEKYIKLIEKAQESIPQFNEYEILDFLFWLRRFRTNRIDTHLKEENIEKLTEKVREFVKSKSFNFRNLVNLFYDLSFLNKSTDEIATELLSELRNDQKLLTPFTVVQILQACSKKGSSLSARQFALVDYITRNLAPMIQEFDSDQKCNVFKYLSQMELNLNPPKYRTPNILYTLRNQLKESLDHLSEIGVINILEAYEDLPSEFPVDLLEEIKEMVILTIQHNSANIKSFFLLDFLERMSNLKRNRRLTDDKIQTIYEEIAKRINNDEYMGRFRNVERLIEIYEKSDLKNEQLIQKIHQRVSDINYPFFSGPIFQFLVNNGVDMIPLIDKFIATDFAKNMGPPLMLRLYIVMSSLPNTKYEVQLKNIQVKLLEKPEDLPRLLNILTNSGVNNDWTNQIILKAIDQLKIKKESLPTSYWKNVFATCANKTARAEWVDFIKQNYADLSAQQINRVIDAFSSIQNPTLEQSLLYVALMSHVFKPENIPFKRHTLALKENKNLIMSLSRIEGKLKSFLVNYLHLLEVHKGEIRIPFIYGLIRRLESCGVKLYIVNSIERKAYELFKTSGANLNSQIELLYAINLLEKGLLKAEEAKELYEKNKANINDPFLSAKIFTYVLRKSDPEYAKNDTVVAEVNEKIEILNKYLSETNSKTVLNALAAILSFPTSFLQKNKDLYVKSIKEFIGFGNQGLFLSILTALPYDQVKSNYEFYVPIMRELINNYGNYNKRMTSGEIIKVLKKFTECGTRNPSIYNYILTDVGRVFNSFKPEEHAEIITAFSRMNIKQTDLFDKILTKIHSNPSNYVSQTRQIFYGFYRTGYDSQQAKTLIPELIEKLKLEKAHIFPYLLYIPVLGLQNEAKILESLIANLKEGDQIPQKNAIILYEYLKYVHKTRPFAESVKKLVKDFDAVNKSVHHESNAVLRNRKAIADYLKAMKVDYQEGQVVNDYKVDFYIPEKYDQQAKVQNKGKLLSNSFSQVNFGGSAILKKRTLESIDGHKAVSINMTEFNSIPEHLNKINYLIAVGNFFSQSSYLEGIENQNTSGMYDFSHIDKVTPAEEQEEEATKEEVAEVAESEEAHEEEKSEKSHQI